ncbi:MAG: hypothetical protein GWP19_12300 [Planctomycetia bacterium]|nr:hypothetical protein [Planctomycetia bacterium]
MNQEMTILITHIPILVLIAVIGYIIPFYLKKENLFGVRLSEKEIQVFKVGQIKQEFKQSYLIVIVLFMLVASILLYSFPQETLGGVLICFQIILLYTILVFYNRKVLSMKMRLKSTDEKFIEDEWLTVDTQTRTKSKILSNLWFIPSILLVLAHFIIALLQFGNLPLSIPLSFDLSGNIIAYTEKTLFSVLRYPAISLFLLIILLGIFFVIKISKQQLSVKSPNKSKIQDTLFRKRWALYFTIFTPLMIIYSIILSLQYLLVISISGWMFIVVSLVMPMMIVVGGLILAIYTGQSGSGINVDIKERKIKTVAVDDNKYWKLGLFYFNSHDPSIIIEKRMGIGWTINFGNPVAVGGFIGFISLLLIYVRIFGL